MESSKRDAEIKKKLFVLINFNCIMNYVRMNAITAVLMKSYVFWDMTLCRLVYMYKHFGGICFLHLHGMQFIPRVPKNWYLHF